MNKKTNVDVYSTIAVFGILFFLFCQHIVCFDFFNSNFWYFYLLAILFSLVQYVIIIVVLKRKQAKICLRVCTIFYTVIFVLKLLQTLSHSEFESYPAGLTILCLILDLVGIVLTSFV